MPRLLHGVSSSPLSQEPDPTWTVPWLLADRVGAWLEREGVEVVAHW